MPPLTPPPASQTVNPCGLWSRPGFWPVWAIGQPAELAAPDHQRLVEQSALVEVRQQAGDRLVGLAGELLVISLDVDVAIPGELVFHAAGVDLDETHASLDQAPGRQALARDMVAARVADAVEPS